MAAEIGAFSESFGGSVGHFTEVLALGKFLSPYLAQFLELVGIHVIPETAKKGIFLHCGAIPLLCGVEIGYGFLVGGTDGG